MAPKKTKTPKKKSVSSLGKIQKKKKKTVKPTRNKVKKVTGTPKKGKVTPKKTHTKPKGTKKPLKRTEKKPLKAAKKKSPTIKATMDAEQIPLIKASVWTSLFVKEIILSCEIPLGCCSRSKIG